MHMSMEMSVSGVGSPITATGNGVVDLRDQATEMSMVMNLGDDAGATQQLGTSTMRIAMILKGTTAYVQLPAAVTAQLPTSGKRWVKVDLAELAGIPGLSSLGSNPTSSDPSQMLRALKSESGTVVDLGPQRVDGLQTTHYQAEVSFDHLLDGLPSSERSAARQALSNLERAMPSGALPVDVWIDADHLVRRITSSIDVNSPSGQSLQETVTADLSDYGPQAPPATPPADQVFDLSSLAKAAIGATS